MSVRSALVIALVAATLAAAPHRNASRAAGWTMTYKTTIETSGGTDPASTGTLNSGKVRIVGPRVRLDPDATDIMSAMMVGPGGWMLIDATTGKMTVVNVSQKTISDFNPAMIAGLAGAMEGMGKSDVNNVIINVEDLGPGGTIGGHVTRHYRVGRSYTVTMTMMGMTQSTKNESLVEYWMASDIDKEIGFEAFAKALVGKMSAGTGGGPAPGVAAKIAEAETAKMPAGFAMRTRTIEKLEGTEKITTTQEITSIVKADVDPTIFALPVGYAKKSMFAIDTGLSRVR